MNLAYVAWIPCVSGRLSLRHISTNQIHKNHIDLPNIHAIVNGRRHTSCFFETNTEDFRVKSKHGEWNALIQMEETGVNPSKFEGKIYWWLKENHERGSAPIKWTKHKWNQLFSKEGESLFSKLAPLYCELQNKQSSTNVEPNKWKQSWQRICNAAEEHEAVFSLEIAFKLQDDGIMYLSRATRKHLGNIDTLSGDQDKTAVRQSFYMIKQCLHLHKHHDSSDDALTTAHDISEISQHWKTEPGLALVNDLKVSLIDFHRTIFGKYSMLDRVSGISAYASSLCQTLARNGLITKSEQEVQEIYFKNIKASISTSARALKFTSDERVARSENRRNLTLLSLAVLSPQVLLYRSLLEKNISTETVTFQVLNNTIPNPSFWVIVLGLYWILPHLRFTARVKEFLTSTGIWGLSLRKLWNRTSKRDNWLYTMVGVILGLSLIALGVLFYLNQAIK